MKIGYFEVAGGCAGDMLAASLVDAGLDPAALERELRALAVGGWRLETAAVERGASFGHPIRGRTFVVTPEKGAWDDHTHYGEIVRTIEASGFSDGRKKKMLAVFDVLARAEAEVHGEPVERVHFHEVGQVDAVVETAAVVVGLEMLGVEKVRCGPVGVANAAPAAAAIARGMPVIPRPFAQEIATPTGLAILRGLCAPPWEAPEMVLAGVGYGAGTRTEPAPNMVRFLHGTSGAEPAGVVEIEMNLDDCSPILFERVMERLFEAGALDVSVLHGQGKKNRPLAALRVLAPEECLERAARALFEETTGIGLRFRPARRIVCDRETRTVETAWGPIPVKIASFAGARVNVSPEYDACVAAARAHRVPLKTVYAAALALAGQGQGRPPDAARP